MNYRNLADITYRSAEHTSRSFNFFNPNKLEDSVELYLKAANYYKLAKEDQLVHDSYLKAAEHQSKYDILESASNYINAAKAIKNINLNKTSILFEKAFSIYTENGKFKLIASNYKELADYYEASNDLLKSILYYEKAIEFYNCDNIEFEINKCKNKLIDLYIKSENYQKIPQIVEEIAPSYINNISKYSLCTYFFKSILCMLNYCHYSEVSSKLSNYVDMLPLFSNSFEYIFLNKIIKAFELYDIQKFNKCLHEYNSIKPIDNILIPLLLSIKEKFCESESLC
jgi:alpha-soluble NSF attachment protein